ncbi:MAG: HesA/MoeB/ThiF family protein [Thermoplasmata archaeon]|nr:HesA/MoeB/ThiF family protein [Thermoplasmata archaeon]
MSRYERQIPIVGEDGQQRLMGARVGIAGCGGLGVNALTFLTEAGVSDFVLCDPDVPDISNLNRQFIYAAGDMRPKCVISAEWVLALNYTAMVDARSLKINAETASVFEGCTVVLDCLDNTESRLALGDWCAANGVPLVHAGVSGNTGQITVCVPGETPCLRCMIGTMRDEERPANLGANVAIVAGMQAAEAIRLIAGLPSKARGRLVTIDMSSWTTESAEVSADPSCPRCGH